MDEGWKAGAGAGAVNFDPVAEVCFEPAAGVMAKVGSHRDWGTPPREIPLALASRMYLQQSQDGRQRYPDQLRGRLDALG